MNVVNGQPHPRWRARFLRIAASLAVMLVVCAVGGYLARPVVAKAVYTLLSPITGGCIAAPNEPTKLADEAVFQRVPAGASSIGGPTVQQPCADGRRDSESKIFGEVTVEYRSDLSDEEIRGHYEAVARESGWTFDVSDRRLVFAMKTLRDRCLWLSVFRDEGGRPGYYSVEVTFWPKYEDSFCDD
ncbi:hypothetical protein [Micromonospora sp. NBC_00858]|uniref:hypothetical protein n=1 Tax=Micromonospora sp. NBC_00858 TaxID=2975979 RepID=UPI00386C5393|nr:hypothetical protein OG990_16270 [Micromonospora sp. NBC_00858]